MSQIIAELKITMNSDGVVSVEGTGQPLQNKVFVFGFLEMAKEVIRSERKVQPADLATVAQFTKQ